MGEAVEGLLKEEIKRGYSTCVCGKGWDGI